MPQTPASVLIEFGLVDCRSSGRTGSPVAWPPEKMLAQDADHASNHCASRCPLDGSAAFSCGYPPDDDAAHATGGSDYRVRIAAERRFFLPTALAAPQGGGSKAPSNSPPVRIRHQPQDREGPWAADPAVGEPDASSVGRRVRRPSLSVVFAISITASAFRWALKGRASPASGV